MRHGRSDIVCGHEDGAKQSTTSEDGKERRHIDIGIAEIENTLKQSHGTKNSHGNVPSDYLENQEDDKTNKQRDGRDFA